MGPPLLNFHKALKTPRHWTWLLNEPIYNEIMIGCHFVLLYLSGYFFLKKITPCRMSRVAICSWLALQIKQQQQNQLLPTKIEIII